MAVQMDWVRDGRELGQLLNEPVVPSALVDGGQHGEGGRVRGVVVHDVAERRVLPVDVHAGGVEGPDEDGVAAGHDLRFRYVDVELAERGLEGPGGDGLDPVGCKW